MLRAVRSSLPEGQLRLWIRRRTGWKHPGSRPWYETPRQFCSLKRAGELVRSVGGERPVPLPGTTTGVSGQSEGQRTDAKNLHSILTEVARRGGRSGCMPVKSLPESDHVQLIIDRRFCITQCGHGISTLYNPCWTGEAANSLTRAGGLDPATVGCPQRHLIFHLV